MRVFFGLYLTTLNTFLYSLPHCQFTKGKFLMYSCEHKSTCKYLKIVHSCVDQSSSEQQHLRLEFSGLVLTVLSAEIECTNIVTARRFKTFNANIKESPSKHPLLFPSLRKRV